MSSLLFFIVFLIILISFEISSVISYAFAIFITLLYYTTLYSVNLTGFSINSANKKMASPVGLEPTTL